MITQGSGLRQLAVEIAECANHARFKSHDDALANHLSKISHKVWDAGDALDERLDKARTDLAKSKDAEFSAFMAGLGPSRWE